MIRTGALETDAVARAGMRGGKGTPRCRICRGVTHPLSVVDGYAYVECERCRFCFCPALTRKKLARLYADRQEGPDDVAPKGGWASPRFLRRAFRRLGDRKLRALDFGCGQSRVPDALREAGHRVIAVDIVPDKSGNPHPDRLTGDLLELELEPEEFDLIYSFQVFEHLPEPRPYLDRLVSLLSPGGLIAIHTDMEAPDREAGLNEWDYAIPPDHCAFYRHDTFRTYCHGVPVSLFEARPKLVLLQKD